jgi:competence protein ComEC
MTVFNVGPGEAILLQLRRRGILVDGGATNSKRNIPLGRAIRGYLVAKGVRLKAIVASHPHVDHLNAIETLLDDGPSEVLAPRPALYHNGQAMAPSLVTTLAAKLDALGTDVIQQVTVRGYAQYPGLGSGKLSMFVGDRSRHGPKYKSIIMSVPFRKARFLLTGDIYTDYEDTFLANPSSAQFLPTTVLKVTHHGSEHGTGASFVERALPRVSVASTASQSNHRLESEVRTRLEEQGAVFDTFTAGGDITVRTDGVQRLWSGHQGILVEVEVAKPGILSS